MREGEEREVEGAAHQGGEESTKGSWDCVMHPSPPGAPFI
jgi:hypothetical protein